MKADRKHCMKYSGFYGAMACLLLLTGCATTSSNYSAPAYRPVNPGAVVVKVSLEKQVIYVMEGSRPLLVTPTTVGKPGHETPVGTFAVLDKKIDKRSGSLGFWVNGSQAVPGLSSRPPGPGWTYKGYPLAYWVRFNAGYGFHEGSVWPMPRTHGCLHLHKNVAASFYELVQVGTPVIVAHSLPEDQTLGRNLKRPTDYADPDPAPSYLLSESFFDGLPKSKFQP